MLISCCCLLLPVQLSYTHLDTVDPSSYSLVSCSPRSDSQGSYSQEWVCDAQLLSRAHSLLPGCLPPFSCLCLCQDREVLTSAHQSSTYGCWVITCNCQTSIRSGHMMPSSLSGRFSLSPICPPLISHLFLHPRPKEMASGTYQVSTTQHWAITHERQATASVCHVTTTEQPHPPLTAASCPLSAA